MPAGFSYTGASGALYHFALVNMANAPAIPWQGGLFVFAKFTPEPLFIAQAENLNAEMTRSAEWAALEEDVHNGITVAYILPEEDPEKRRSALDDLLEMYQPPLNR